MTENVISLHGEPIPEGEQPFPAIIQFLEEILMRAARGEITSIALVINGPEIASHNWLQRDGRLDDWLRLVGQVDLMKHELLEWLRQQVATEV